MNDCHYYLQSELIIEYTDKNGRRCVIKTMRKLERCYITEETSFDFDKEVERILSKKNYDKILYENGWIKESYRKKYANILCREFKEVTNIRKIYKKTTSWKQ
jgi:hypothetical protein